MECLLCKEGSSSSFVGVNKRLMEDQGVSSSTGAGVGVAKKAFVSSCDTRSASVGVGKERLRALRPASTYFSRARWAFW